MKNTIHIQSTVEMKISENSFFQMENVGKNKSYSSNSTLRECQSYGGTPCVLQSTHNVLWAMILGKSDKTF